MVANTAKNDGWMMGTAKKRFTFFRTVLHSTNRKITFHRTTHAAAGRSCQPATRLARGWASWRRSLIHICTTLVTDIHTYIPCTHTVLGTYCFLNKRAGGRFINKRAGGRVSRGDGPRCSVTIGIRWSTSAASAPLLAAVCWPLSGGHCLVVAPSCAACAVRQ